MSSPRERLSCSQCAQSFTRKEHLQRHQAKHNAVRPYKCGLCAKTFSRSDVLKRHEALHENTGRVERNLHAPKTRTSFACDRCSAAKIRCIGQIPCENCLEKDLVCTINRSNTIVKRRNALPLYTGASAGDSVDYMNTFPPPGGDDRSLASDQSIGESAAPETSNQQWAILGVRSPDIPDIEHSARIGNQEESIITPPASEMSLPNFGVPDAPMLDFSDRNDGSFWTNFYPHPHDMTAAMGDFSHPFWLANDNVYVHPSTEALKGGQRSRTLERGSQNTRGRGDDVELHNTITTNDNSNPYAESHLVYLFKAGPYVKHSSISDFLQDRTAWELIDTTERKLEPRKQWGPLVTSIMRDIISARIHGILQTVLDKHYGARIPHMFPSKDTIQSLFQAYCRHMAVLYPITHPSTFSEANLVTYEPYNDIGILLSTIMALGCLIVPVPQARLFSSELVYLIRNTINERAIHDEASLTDVWTMTTLIIMTIYGAWSGVKRHLELVEAYRSSFTTLFIRRGFYRSCPPVAEEQMNVANWSAWVNQERDRRLCQTWYIVDQELSLFYCVPPTIMATNICCPMPAADEFYFAKTEEAWRDLIDAKAKEEELAKSLHPPSLATFWYMFLRQDFHQLSLDITPLRLRLLLCAIQSQVLQFSHNNRLVPAIEDILPLPTIFTTGNYNQVRQEELQNMLMKWNVLRQRVLGPGCLTETALSCTLIFHLLSMELFICYEDIQLIAGKEGHANATPLLPQLQQWAKSLSAWRAIAHAGQVLKALQWHPLGVQRPPWWPLAIPRAALVMWSYVVGLYLATGSTTGLDEDMLSMAPLTALYDRDDDFGTNGKFFRMGEVVLCLHDSKGVLVPLHQVSDMLTVFIDLLEEGKSQSLPVCESMQRILLDIRSAGIPYPKGC